MHNYKCQCDFELTSRAESGFTSPVNARCKQTKEYISNATIDFKVIGIALTSTVSNKKTLCTALYNTLKYEAC